ncbi:MAG TPA: TIGR03086 family metal-binding protein [Acidimicrobiales bacterium]|nr:TIGR03086 family metal-binding protein [Acidimicrobiales bacterium]
MSYTDEQLVDFFVRASAFFGEQVRTVDDESWSMPTPCEGWDVQTVVAHVVVGDAQIPVLLGGGQVERVEEFNPTVLGPNPLATWRGTALAAIRAFGAPGALQQRYPHPVGNVRGRTIIGFRISDSLVHGWDVATALGESVTLDPELCQYCLDFWFPMAATLPDSGFYKAALMPPDGADVSARLLALLGRRA